jgi:lipopolysaccharide transport system ATP-binding protein
MSDVLIQAEKVSKKFCRSLKRSLWYGMSDVFHSLNPWSTNRSPTQDVSNARDEELRPQEFWALRDVSFEVRRGECLGLIGHNGAGKSTLLKILNGVIRPDRGQITMRGRIGAMIELGAGFNPLLTGRENIYNQAALLGFSPEEVKRKFDDIVDFSEIPHALDMPLQNYSSGMRIRLGFSIFAHLEPDILLIDEVLAVGDVGFRMKSLNKMSELMNRCAVIFVSHSMPQIFRICSEVMLLGKGGVKFHGRNIADGVAAYFREFPGEEQTITGTGDARVLQLSAKGQTEQANLHEALTIQYGEDIDICVDIQLQHHYKSANIQLLFWNIELLPIMDVMTKELNGFSFIVDENGRGTVTARLCQVLLNAGKYNVSVIILSDDLTVLCRHDNAVTVTVAANCASGASVIFPAEWQNHLGSLPQPSTH